MSSERSIKSRWGSSSRDGNRQQQRQQRSNNNGHGFAVSDEDAVKALLFSAEQRSREREGRSNDRGDPRGGRFSGRDDRRNHSNNNGRSRGSDHSRNENYGHYGPSNDNNINDGYERKRKRFSDRENDSEPHRVEDDDKPTRSNNEDAKPTPEVKPNFGLSGALSKDTRTGNVYKGVVLKFKEPPEGRTPNTQWRLYVFKPNNKNNDGKNDDLVETLHMSKQSAYLFGRNADVCDVVLLHPSLSSQHAVLQYRAVPNTEGKLSCRPYIMDLESTNGTFLNKIRIDAARYYELKKGDVLTFGASTREYVFLTEHTTSVK